MKVLIVSNQGLNKDGIGNPILYRMTASIAKDNRIDNIKFQPVSNSISSFFQIRKIVKNYDLIHIHFGGLYALILRGLLIGKKVKSFITFHGTDIHAKAIKSAKSRKEIIKIKLNQYSSFLSLFIFDRSGFVSEDMIQYIPPIIRNATKRKFFIQSLGVNYDLFKPIDKAKAWNHLNLQPNKYVLFSDVSKTTIKRRDIAENIVNNLKGYKILVMSGVKPEDVPFYINASEFAILTSDEEGSPNIIREVLSLNKPFFSVCVGDAQKQLNGLVNSAIIDRNPSIAAKTIEEKINQPYVDYTRSNLRNRLDFDILCKNIVDLYEQSI